MASRLLIDVGPAVGAHGQRGIGRYVRGLAIGIATFPDDLVDRIWAVGFPGPTLRSFGARGIALNAHPGFRCLPAWIGGRLGTDSALRAIGARVLHVSDPQRAWSDRKVSTLVTVYDLIPLREPALFRSWRLDHRLLYRRYLHQIRTAARILSISQTTADDLQELLGVVPEVIDIVYPLVVPPVKIRRMQTLEPTFLVVGALDAHKQPELALYAFGQYHARVASGRLRFIGPAEPSQKHRLHLIAAQLGLAGLVSVEGRITDDELEEAYGMATALVSTSRIEGFGLPSVEAVLRGVPVIAVESPAAIETLDGVAMMVPADAEAIAHAMAHPRQPSELAVNRIRERYSIANVAQSLEDAYRRVLDQR